MRRIVRRTPDDLIDKGIVHMVFGVPGQGLCVEVFTNAPVSPSRYAKTKGLFAGKELLLVWRYVEGRFEMITNNPQGNRGAQGWVNALFKDKPARKAPRTIQRVRRIVRR